MIWTFFVLDMDVTYGNEQADSCGVRPLVYLIPLENQRDVEYYAVMAGLDFNSERNKESGLCVGDYFEEWLSNNGVDFKLVGSIDLAFSERQTDYLAEYIPREVV